MDQSHAATSLPPVAPTAGGTTTRPSWSDSLAPSLSSTYAGPADTTQHVGVTTLGAGDSARRWNQSKAGSTGWPTSLSLSIVPHQVSLSLSTTSALAAACISL
jgi:hypothetical protein